MTKHQDNLFFMAPVVMPTVVFLFWTFCHISSYTFSCTRNLHLQMLSISTVGLRDWKFSYFLTAFLRLIMCVFLPHHSHWNDVLWTSHYCSFSFALITCHGLLFLLEHNIPKRYLLLFIKMQAAGWYSNCPSTSNTFIILIFFLILCIVLKRFHCLFIVWTHRHPFMTQFQNQLQNVLAMSNENVKEHYFDHLEFAFLSCRNREQEKENLLCTVQATQQEVTVYEMCN